MKVTLNNTGRRFNNEWIFRGIDLEFSTGNNYAILGGNGSGKSTLLQVIAGSLLASEGEVNYRDSKGEEISPENIYTQLSIATPYLDLFEEYTLAEAAGFQEKLKPFMSGIDIKKIPQICDLEKAKEKQIKHFSSGMRQRVKLALAILSDTPLLLLDEPTSNFDKNAIAWYKQLMDTYAKNRLVIVCSNQQQHEYDFCNVEINVENYKQVS